MPSSTGMVERRVTALAHRRWRRHRVLPQNDIQSGLSPFIESLFLFSRGLPPDGLRRLTCIHNILNIYTHSRRAFFRPRGQLWGCFRCLLPGWKLAESPGRISILPAAFSSQRRTISNFHGSSERFLRSWAAQDGPRSVRWQRSAGGFAAGPQRGRAAPGPVRPGRGSWPGCARCFPGAAGKTAHTEAGSTFRLFSAGSLAAFRSAVRCRKAA